MKKFYLRSLVASLLLLRLLDSGAQYFPGGFPKANVSLWFDASDTSQMTGAMTGISSWKDKTGKFTAAQATAARRPLRSLQDNKPVVEYIGKQGLDMGYQASLVPSKGYYLAQSLYLYPDASTAVTDFRVGTFSANNINLGSPFVGVRYVPAKNVGKYCVAANRNNTGYYYSQYNDLRGTWFLGGNYTPAANNKTYFYINGGGNLSSVTAGYVNNKSGATLGNRNGNYDNVHWGIGETVLLAQDLKASGRRILDLYLATKWGMADTLQYGLGATYFYPTDPDFTSSLLGIGTEGGGDSISYNASNNGLAFENINNVTGFLRESGDYLFAADNDLSGATPAGTEFNRWNRSWYVQKTDIGGYGGNLYVDFDFANYLPGKLDTANLDYYLLYNPTNGYFNSDKNYFVPVRAASRSASGEKMRFLLDGVDLSTGFYTLAYCAKGSPRSGLDYYAPLAPISVDIKTPPDISVVPGNTYNYVTIDAQSIKYSVAYYKIWVSLNGGPFSLLDSTIGTPSYYPHYNLANGTTYTYWVSAVYAPGKESVPSLPASGTPGVYSPSWLIKPQYKQSGQIFMAASAPKQGLPLKYYFDNVSGGGRGRAYATDYRYTDSLLTNGSIYSYRFKYMDTVMGTATESDWSSLESVVLVDSLPGGFTFNMTYLDPNTPYAPYGIGPSHYYPAGQDMTGIRYIKHVPPVGIHPRVYCNPEDSTEIRNRLKNTKSGQYAAKWIHAYTTLVQLGYGKFNRNAWYNKDTLGNNYITNVGASDIKSLYDSLALGDIGKASNYDNSFGGNAAKMAYMLSFEAMECWLYRNTIDKVTNTSYASRADKLAKAITVWAGKAIADSTLGPHNNMDFGGLHMALIYDFLFDQMNKGQQDSVRKAILKILPDSSFEHGFQTPSYTNISNWSTFGGEILTNVAVEGEPGYSAKDSGLLRIWIRNVWNFITYGIYDKTGDMYEGIGKNRINASLLIAMAKRGFSVLGHPSIRSYASKYLPAVVQPFGYSFIGTDILGGTGIESPSTGGWNPGWMDPGGLKWIYPTDTAVDFVWRNLMQRPYPTLQLSNRRTMIIIGFSASGFVLGDYKFSFLHWGAFVFQHFVDRCYFLTWLTALNNFDSLIILPFHGGGHQLLSVHDAHDFFPFFILSFLF